MVANHLWLVRAKPELVVSNGDVLRGFGPIHYFYGVALWIPATIAVLVLLSDMPHRDGGGRHRRTRGR